MRTRNTFLSLYLISFALTGCSTVITPVPPGTPIPADEAKKLEGIWLTPREGDESYPFFVKHIQGNEFRIAFVGWKEKEFKLEQKVIYVTESGGQKFLNISEPADSETSGYQFFRLSVPDQEHAILNDIQFETFEKAHKDGVLKGVLDKEDWVDELRLEITAEELGKFLDPAKAGEQFNLEKAMVFTRLGGFESKKEDKNSR